jgi:hypothetical protein
MNRDLGGRTERGDQLAGAAHVYHLRGPGGEACHVVQHLCCPQRHHVIRLEAAELEHRLGRGGQDDESGVSMGARLHYHTGASVGTRCPALHRPILILFL